MPQRTAPTSPPASRTPLLIGGGILLVVVLAAIVAIALSGTSPGGLAEPARSTIGVSGDPLPAFTDPATDPAVGQPMPTLTGTDLDGEPITIDPSDGPMAVVVLAHWCDHCQAEVPVLVDYLASTGMPDGVRLVGLSTSIDPARPNYPPSSWLENEGWTVPTMVDDGTSRALAGLGLTSFPGFVFIDGDGQVVQRHSGRLSADEFDQAVRSLAP
jgi:hypothetical protein